MQLLQLQLKWEEQRNRKLGIAVPRSIGAGHGEEHELEQATNSSSSVEKV